MFDAWPTNCVIDVAKHTPMTPPDEQQITPSARLGQVDKHSAANALVPGLSLREKVRRASRQIESAIIIEALEQHRWNRRRTAESLKISYRSLMYKMKNCDLRGERPGLRTGEHCES
jgi:DNA-binding NtrC family response regulator